MPCQFPLHLLHPIRWGLEVGMKDIAEQTCVDQRPHEVRRLRPGLAVLGSKVVLVEIASPYVDLIGHQDCAFRSDISLSSFSAKNAISAFSRASSAFFHPSSVSGHGP